MLHAGVLGAYIHFTSMYTAYYIFPILPIRELINEDDKPTTPFKLATGMKPSGSHLSILCCPCVVRKYTENIGTKALNMRHQVQKGFRGIFVWIPQHQKEYIFNVTHRQKVIFSCDVVFDERLYSVFLYMSQPYSVGTYTRQAVSYIPYTTSSRYQTGNIITFTQFEEGDLFYQTRDDMETSNKSDDDSTLPPLISEK